MPAKDDLTRVDLNLLVILLTLLETRSVTKTAERSGMSQPAVSRALAKLRVLFDDALLVKAGTVMRPTVRGSALLEPLQKALAGMGAVLAGRAPFEPSRTERVFRIATTDYGATVILPRLAGLMFSAAPKATLEIVPVDGQTFRQLGKIAGHPALGRSEQGRLRLEDYVACSHILVTVIGGRTGTVDTALAALGQSRHIAVRIPILRPPPSSPPVLTSS